MTTPLLNSAYTRSEHIRALWPWLPLWTAMALLAIFAHGPMPMFSTRTLAVAWEMWQHGEWLVPHINGQPYSHKVPLLFWLIHAGWLVGGVNDVWPRILEVLIGAGWLLAGTLLARRVFARRPEVAAIVPWLLLALSYAFLFGLQIMYEVMLALWVALALACIAQRPRWGWFALCVGAGLIGGPGLLHAQEPTPPGEDTGAPPPDTGSPPADTGAPPPDTGAPPPDDKVHATETNGATTEPAKQKGQLGSLQWKAILVVPRRPILKYHRVELVPTYNLTVNNTLVRTHGFGGIVNFFLSETLALGIEANYLQPQQLEQYGLRGLDDRVLPSMNRYFWNASVDFSYIPVYGKFALFNRYIFQWEAYVEAGIGAMESQWISRDPADAAATNFLVQGHLGLGTRLFLTKWLVIHAYLKDYLFADKFEPANRAMYGTAVPPSSTFESRFVQNVTFGVGVGMFLPTNFEYKYTR